MTTIDDIVNDLPEPKASTKENAKIIRKQYQDYLRRELSKYEILPHAFAPLKEYIIKKYKESMLDSGDPVGIHFGESIGSQLTQSSLNSFHTSGVSKNITYGLVGFNEIVNNTKKRKAEIITMFFKDNYSYNEIFELRKLFISSNLGVNGEIVEDFDIINRTELEIPSWYDDFITINGIRLPDSQYIARIKLNKYYMYALGIVMDDVYNAFYADGTKSPVVLVCSPSEIGIIDIYPGKQFEMILERRADITEIPLQYTDFTALNVIIRKNLDKIKVKVIDDVVEFLPEINRLASGVLSIDKQQKNMYRILFNFPEMKFHGFSLADYIRVLKVKGIKILSQDEDDFMIETDSYPKSPQDIFNDTFYFASANSSNLEEFISHPLIDPRKTYSNNLNSIYRFLGIEAARTLIVKEIKDNVIASDIKVHPVHIEIIGDIMCSLGFVNSLDRGGLNRQPENVLMKATFQNQIKIFKEAAALNKKDPVSSVSTAIVLGQKPMIGTNFSDHLLGDTIISRKKDLLDKAAAERKLVSETVKFDSDDFNNMLEQELLNIEVQPAGEIKVQSVELELPTESRSNEEKTPVDNKPELSSKIMAVSECLKQAVEDIPIEAKEAKEEYDPPFIEETKSTKKIKQKRVIKKKEAAF